MQKCKVISLYNAFNAAGDRMSEALVIEDENNLMERMFSLYALVRRGEISKVRYVNIHRIYRFLMLYKAKYDHQLKKYFK